MSFRLILAIFLTLSPAAHAGPIEKACLKADRSKATRALCSCIQDVADTSLNNKDQAEAASFFEDPQKAQDTRMSDNPQKEKFWERYKNWTERASKVCG